MKLNLQDWQKRWDEFSDNGNGYIWFGVDRVGNIAQFSCEESFVPEVFFQDKKQNKYLMNYFENLPESSRSLIPINLRDELKISAEKNNIWEEEARRGLFLFEEPTDNYWYDKGFFQKYVYSKNPYELRAIPENPLIFSDLPSQIQEILKLYNLENIKFNECQFLDVSKHLYCEK